jgi:DNA-binding NarL/FixJ family response regulator
MNSNTLLVCRDVKNHAFFKMRLEAYGFTNVTCTDLEKDALYFLIRDLKPTMLLMSAKFYECCTPFLMKELKYSFPKLKMAALSVGNYPCELAMYFILNGINSYVTMTDGLEQWKKGLTEISKGKDWVSPSVVERISMRKEYPKPAGNLTDRHKEVIKLICCGWKDLDICDTLQIARSTVDKHKHEIFTTLNVTGANELVRAVLTLGLVTLQELFFYPKNLVLNPKPATDGRCK